MGLTGELFADAEMTEILCDRRWLEAMLDFEAALARSEAEVGVIPKTAAKAIASCCDVGFYDITEIGRRATLAGNPAIPLVAMLTEKVREKDPAAAEFVHFGATSQDVIDSALGLVLEDGLRRLLERLARCCAHAARLAAGHRGTVMPGRTLLQHALPVSFGHKAALWLDALVTSHDNVMSRSANWLQFGGAAGTLASLGQDAIPVRVALADARLPRRDGYGRGFVDPTMSWHANRAHIQLIAANLGILSASLGKIARDIALLMQTEVAEVFESAASGKGGSSTLPQKRNPVQTTAIIAIATRTPGLVATMLSAGMQEHERAVGGWHAEWDTLRELLTLSGAATLHMQSLLEGLEIDTERMRANMELSNGLIMAERLTFALAPSLGKAKAKAFMEAACKRSAAEKRHLREVLRDAEEAKELDLEALFDPSTYLGVSNAFIDRILALYEKEKEYMIEDTQHSTS